MLIINIIPMIVPLFLATKRFDPADGEKWNNYCGWAKIPALAEVVSLDTLLCPRLVQSVEQEDWAHIVNEDFRLDYFYHLDYLLQKIHEQPRRNVLGLYRNPAHHITEPPVPGHFTFVGYDLIEEQTQISALTNCGGFPDTFQNEELNTFGLLSTFTRAAEVRQQLATRHPAEAHAQCELYALWRLNEIE